MRLHQKLAKSLKLLSVPMFLYAGNKDEFDKLLTEYKNASDEKTRQRIEKVLFDTAQILERTGSSSSLSQHITQSFIENYRMMYKQDIKLDRNQRFSRRSSKEKDLIAQDMDELLNLVSKGEKDVKINLASGMQGHFIVKSQSVYTKDKESSHQSCEPQKDKNLSLT
jgi:hypothetical protein